MDDNRPETGVMGGGESIGIVNSAATVSICVCEDYDMLISDALKPVGKVLEAQCGKIPVHIEGAESGAERCPLPVVLKRHGDPALLRRKGNGHEIEPAGVFSERFVLQQGIDSSTGILVEKLGFLRRVAFSDNSYVYAILRASALVQIFVRSRIRSHFPYEDVGRIYRMGEGCVLNASVAEQLHGDSGGLLRHWKQIDILEGFSDSGSLLRSLPLLEQSRESLPVEDLAAGGIAQGDAAVSCNRNLVHIDPPACPALGS